MDIASLGECMVEFYSDEPISIAKTFHRSAAGDTLNTVIAASRLGSKCGYITKVGEDAFGDFLVNRMKFENIDVSHAIRVPGGSSGIYFISLLADGQREFIYYRKGSAASKITPKDLDETYIRSAKILHTSGISQAISEASLATVEEAVRIAKRNNVTVSFDPNYRSKLWSKEKALKAYEELLPHVDIVFPDETYGGLINRTDPADILSYFAEFDIPIVALKLGKKGALVQRRGGDARAYGVLSFEAKDTTGAGDAFDGGFLHGICENKPVEVAALLGTITANLKIRGRGAVEPLPFRDEVYSILEEINAKKRRLD